MIRIWQVFSFYMALELNDFTFCFFAVRGCIISSHQPPITLDLVPYSSLKSVFCLVRTWKVVVLWICGTVNCTKNGDRKTMAAVINISCKIPTQRSVNHWSVLSWQVPSFQSYGSTSFKRTSDIVVTFTDTCNNMPTLKGCWREKSSVDWKRVSLLK